MIGAIECLLSIPIPTERPFPVVGRRSNGVRRRFISYGAPAWARSSRIKFSRSN
jgi:hypothetical protein